jgi:proline iminopeptidase
LHGGPGFDHSGFRPWFDRFADQVQVIYVDHRGNGRSGGAPETWTLDPWADDVRALSDALGLVWRS